MFVDFDISLIIDVGECGNSIDNPENPSKCLDKDDTLIGSWTPSGLIIPCDKVSIPKAITELVWNQFGF